MKTVKQLEKLLTNKKLNSGAETQLVNNAILATRDLEFLRQDYIKLLNKIKGAAERGLVDIHQLQILPTRIIMLGDEQIYDEISDHLINLIKLGNKLEIASNSARDEQDKLQRYSII